MGDPENIAPPTAPVFTTAQLDKLAEVLLRSLTRANIAWLGTSVLGRDAEQEVGSNIGDAEAFAKRVVELINAEGRIPEAISKLRERAHPNAYLTVVLNRLVNGEELTESALQQFVNDYEPFVSSKKFQEYYPKLLRTVCAVALGNPTNSIVGSGFLIGPDLVMTNFHVIDTFLKVDDQGVVTENGLGSEMFFFFDYLSAPVPDVPPQDRQLVVAAAPQWLVHARKSLEGDGTKASKPLANKEYDYAIVRLARRVGALSVRKGGGDRRGWLPLPTQTIDTLGQKKVFVFQHPERKPQQWDMGDFVQLDQTESRVWYTVSTAHGSSGGAVVDIDGQLYALHNAEVESALHMPANKKLNQGIRIDKIAEDLKAEAPDVLKDQDDQNDTRLFWSLSDDAASPSPIIGRARFREMLIEMLDLNSERVLVVTGPPGSGRRYSIKLLEHTLGVGVPFIVFTPSDLQTLEPKKFLEVIITELGMPQETANSIPDVLSTENVSRWLRLDVPQWLRDRLDGDQKKNPSRYPAWIVINTIRPADERLLWANNLKDCIAALVGAHDPGQPNIEIPQLRWLFLSSPNESLPTGGVKQREEDLGKNNDYGLDFGECYALAYRSIDKEAEIQPKTITPFALKELSDNDKLPEAQRLPPRKVLSDYIVQLLTNDPALRN